MLTQIPRSLAEEVAGALLDALASLFYGLLWRLQALRPPRLRRAVLLEGGVLLGTLTAVAGYHWSLMSPLPSVTGGDPGNWLAIGKEMFGRQDVKAVWTPAPPFTPLLAYLLTGALGPLTALKAIAVTASVAMGLPFYLLIRRGLPSLLALPLTAVLLLLPYQTEVMLWGGYPQLFGTLFLLLTLYWLHPAVEGGRPRHLILAAVGLVLTLASHQLMVLELVVAIPIYATVVAWQAHLRVKHLVGRLTAVAVIAVALASPLIPLYLSIFGALAGNPANPLRNPLTVSTLVGYASYVYKGMPAWPLLAFLSPLSLLVPSHTRQEVTGAEEAEPGPHAGLKPLVASLLLAPAIAFVALIEVRTFQLLQVGQVASVALALGWLWHRFLRARLDVRTATVMASSALLVLLLVLYNGIGGHPRNRFLMVHYAVVDDYARDALDWIRQNTPPDAVFIAGTTPVGQFYNWWIEGYAGRHAYNIDTAFLYGHYREEIENILYANAVLASVTQPYEAEEMLTRRNIRYLFIDKGASEPFRWITQKVPLQVAYENARILILEFRGGGAILRSQ